MREPSVYFSDTFQNIWLGFSKTLKAAKTKADYFRLLCEICDYCECDFLELTPDDGVAFFEELARREVAGALRHSTVVVYFSKLSAMTNFIINEGLRYGVHNFRNPFYLVKISGLDHTLMKSHVPNLSEMDSILSMGKADLQLYTIISLVIRCSLTTSELSGIMRNKIIQDGNGNYAFILKCRMGERYVKIPDDVMSLVERVIREYDSLDGTLFVNTRKRALTQRSIERLYCKYVVFADNEPHYSLSDLRNGSIANFLLNDNIDRSALSSYINISETWLNRFDAVLPELESAPPDLVNIQIKPI